MIAAIDAHEMIELVMGEDDGVEIELFEIARRLAFDDAAAIRTRAMRVIHARGIGGQEAAAMGHADLEPRIGIEHAAEDEMADRDRRVQGIADDVDEVMVAEAASLAEAVGMHEDE